ncbi:MAG: acetate/propionate family kinase [Candidatus Saccharibacteria bacterium]|nr:acetate/propionate family kinase [Candidatus Saccharibacteria bacterium]
MAESIIFIVNPGSASRKYALYINGVKKANLHFEIVDEKVVGELEYDGNKYSEKYDDANLANAPHRTLPLLHKYKILNESDKISAIGIRIVAPSKRFMQDELVTDEVVSVLEDLSRESPLHIKTALLEIKQLRIRFPETPIIAVSDSAFHATKPAHARYYAIDTKLADKLEIEKYGFHGVSIRSIVNKLEKGDILLPKTVICHLGSGCSVTAVENGKSVETTMGYSPLEGVVMATRSGSIDVSAALAIKRDLGFSPGELEEFLFRKSGLLGLSGSSDDIRQLIASEAKGDARAKLALDIFVYRIQQAIGQMAASMNGVSCLVFTGTVGERSITIRGRILERLGYLGFEISPKANEKAFEPVEIANIANLSSKPVLVVLTDEAAELAHRTEKYIKNK